ncbi:hypothetical protein [Micromonospora chalcea]|uniref:hypothetical protein n=1 Tax=Micromonospora chalcea TaxID=1874 RepID=UPI00381735A5
MVNEPLGYRHSDERQLPRLPVVGARDGRRHVIAHLLGLLVLVRHGVLLLLRSLSPVQFVAGGVEAGGEHPTGGPAGHVPHVVGEPGRGAASGAQLRKPHTPQHDGGDDVAAVRPAAASRRGSNVSSMRSKLPGKPVSYTTIYRRLRTLGFPMRGARVSAIRQLVLQAPAPVVADALGFHEKSTARQVGNAGATWSRYVHR